MRWRTMWSMAAAAVLSGLAQAQPAALGNWPERMVRVIVAAPAGSPSDLVARLAVEQMRPRFGQTLVVENKPGAGGSLAGAELQRAAPDGHVWMLAPDPVFTVNPHVQRKPVFQAGEIVPVFTATRLSQTLVCHPALGVKTLAQLLQKARAQKLDYASGGPTTPGHLASEMLLASTGISMQHIPFGGPVPATQAVLAGTVPCGFLAGPTVLPHVLEGHLVALAVSGATRSQVLPEVPMVAEAGVPGYDATFSMVLFAPRGTPAPVIQSFTSVMAEALRAPPLVERLKSTDQEVVAFPPAQTAALMAGVSARWAAVVKKIQLQID